MRALHDALCAARVQQCGQVENEESANAEKRSRAPCERPRRLRCKMFCAREGTDDGTRARTADNGWLRLHGAEFRCRTEPLTVRTFLLMRKLCAITSRSPASAAGASRVQQHVMRSHIQFCPRHFLNRLPVCARYHQRQSSCHPPASCSTACALESQAQRIWEQVDTALATRKQ